MAVVSARRGVARAWLARARLAARRLRLRRAGRGAAAPAGAAGGAGRRARPGSIPARSRPPPSIWLEPELAAADAARGELLGLACAACHKFRAEEGTLIGPHLHGVFGRRGRERRRVRLLAGAARSPGSSGRRASLEAWLAEPAGFVEGTTMAFTGYRVGRRSARPDRLPAARDAMSARASESFTLESDVSRVTR